MQVTPQPRGPAVCFLENEDLDRRIPNVWGFQLLHSATTQPPAKSKPFTPLVNFTPLSEDRGLSSYPLHRSLPLRLSVSGPSAADSAASGPSAVNVSVCGPSAACVTTAGHSAVYCPTPSGPSADFVLLPVPVPLQLPLPASAPRVLITSVPAPLMSLLLAPMPPVSLLPAPVPSALLHPAPAPPTVPTTVACQLLLLHPLPLRPPYLIKLCLHQIHLHLSVVRFWLNHA